MLASIDDRLVLECAALMILDQQGHVDHQVRLGHEHDAGAFEGIGQPRQGNVEMIIRQLLGQGLGPEPHKLDAHVEIVRQSRNQIYIQPYQITVAIEVGIRQVIGSIPYAQASTLLDSIQPVLAWLQRDRIGDSLRQQGGVNRVFQQGFMIKRRIGAMLINTHSSDGIADAEDGWHDDDQ